MRTRPGPLHTRGVGVGVGGRRHIAKRAVRPNGVVVDPPRLEDAPSVSEALDAVHKAEYARLKSLPPRRQGAAPPLLRSRRNSPKWQRLDPYEKFAATIDRHWDGIAAYCRPENKVSLGLVEGLNNKIRVIQRRAYGLRDEDYLRLKILTCMLPDQ